MARVFAPPRASPRRPSSTHGLAAAAVTCAVLTVALVARRGGDAAVVGVIVPPGAPPGSRAPRPPVAFARVFGRGMVLRAGAPGAAVWGRGPPGAPVAVSLVDGGEPPRAAQLARTVVADAAGVWRLLLPPRAAGGPYTLSATPAVGTRGAGPLPGAVIDDVWFGTVLLCGGQSNAEFSVAGMLGGAAEVSAAARGAYDHIRLFSVDQRTNSSAPLRDLRTTELEWARPSEPGALDGGGAAHGVYGPFSAVCWVAARALSDALAARDTAAAARRPIGVIAAAWGGSGVLQWLSPFGVAGLTAPPPEVLPRMRASPGRESRAEDWGLGRRRRRRSRR